MRLDDPDLPHVSAEQIEAGRKVIEAGLTRGDNLAWVAFDVFVAMTKAGKPSTDRPLPSAPVSRSVLPACAVLFRRTLPLLRRMAMLNSPW
jgi:hypothetical protein